MESFKKRVDSFYQWFDANESILRQKMTEDKIEEAYTLLAPQINMVLKELLFEIHYDQKKKRYSLELITFLDDSKKIIGLYFCDCLSAKLKANWDFYYYHPAFKGTVSYKDKSYGPKDFQIVPLLNERKHKIDICVVNGKDFKGMSDQDKFMITYMILSDYLGELTVDSYIGGITFGRMSLFKKPSKEKAVPLANLDQHIEKMLKEKNWIRPKNIRLIASGFKSKTKSVAARKDFIEGFSYCLDVLNEEESGNFDLTDYIKSLGIEYYSLCISNISLNEKQQKEKKNEIERELSAILAAGKNGFIVSSIDGRGHHYVDFFLYDHAVLDSIVQLQKKYERVELLKL